jgi:anti-sigma B factor antagonist
MNYTLNSAYNKAREKWDVALGGEIDISNAHLLKAELETAYAEHAADMTIDIDKLSYIDSTGLGVIISLYGIMKDGGNKLTIVNPKDSVKKLLKITKFDKILY